MHLSCDLTELVSPLPKSLSMEEYARFIEWEKIVSSGTPFRAAVVIVAYAAGRNGLVSCLEALRAQTEKPLQIIVVDNASPFNLSEWVAPMGADYLRLRQNYGPTLARNVGVLYTKAPVICFIDDDGVPDRRLVETHLRAYEERHAVACRGKYVPESTSPYLGLTVCDTFDYGPDVKPAPLNVEGNMSILKSVFESVGGFNPRIFGFEGRELTTRLLARGISKNQILYLPGAILRHEVRSSLAVQVAKEMRHVQAMRFAQSLNGHMVGMSGYDLQPRDFLKQSPWNVRLSGRFLRGLFNMIRLWATVYYRWKLPSRTY